MDLKKTIADVPDFPTKGVLFRDITPLMQEPQAFHQACDAIIEFARSKNIDVVAGPESRGFIFGCPVAYELNVGFVPVRKPGKLPRETVSVTYDLEYGHNTLHMHKDSVKPGQRVLIIDDLLATGGTVDATRKLVEMMGGEVVGAAFLIELVDLKGRQLLSDMDVFTVMQY